jgi:diguanylate cyclase (GGDEF)-like protein
MFLWTLIIGLVYITTNPYITYYASLTIYPLVFLLTALIFLAIMKYLNRRVPKLLIYFFVLFFILDIGFSYTNNLHQLVLQIGFSNSLTYDMISSANHGTVFYIHTAICYSILLIAMVSIMGSLFNNLKKEKDVFPFVTMVLAIILGITANIIHIFVYSIALDPTYIALVLLITLLYGIFYMRDLKLIFKFNGNEFILNNLREMYLLVNQRGIIISASNELVSRFKLDIESELTFDDFKRLAVEKAVIYKDSKSIENYYDKNKIYLHMMEKEINLPFLKHSGKFYLFYDETQNQKNINDINYVMTHDLMTKIYNRNYFESLEKDIENNYNNYSLIMFDLDGLKLFNDYLGHSEGDKLLIRFAETLKDISKKYENLIPIRMGGDEFLLIALNKDMNDIEEIVYDLKKNTSSTNLSEHIGFSYGYSQNNFSNKRFRKVLIEADVNLYTMKTSRKKAKEELEEYLKRHQVTHI